MANIVSDGRADHVPEAGLGFPKLEGMELDEWLDKVDRDLRFIHKVPHDKLLRRQLPKGYTVWIGKDRPDRQLYILGHPRHVAFDSKVNWCKHLVWLIRGRKGTCECPICTDSRWVPRNYNYGYREPRTLEERQGYHSKLHKILSQNRRASTSHRRTVHAHLQDHPQQLLQEPSPPRSPSEGGRSRLGSEDSDAVSIRTASPGPQAQRARAPYSTGGRSRVVRRRRDSGVGRSRRFQSAPANSGGVGRRSATRSSRPSLGIVSRAAEEPEVEVQPEKEPEKVEPAKPAFAFSSFMSNIPGTGYSVPARGLNT